MPIVTDITPQKRRENRRNVFLDGRFAFGCNLNVIARFHLAPGLNLSDDQIREIEFGVVKQECFDKATDYLSRRQHSRAELIRKLSRKDWATPVIDAMIEDLVRLNYLDDAKFARAKATSCATRKRLGQRRAYVDLIRAGVKSETAGQALAEIYRDTDTSAVARALALKAAPRLKKLDLSIARRRLMASLLRRGFSYQEVRPVVEEILPRR